PLDIYFGNSAEFSIHVAELLSVGLSILVVLVAFWALLIKHVLVLQFPRAVATAVACAIAVWLQGHVLVWKYGPFDGRAIEWDKFSFQGYIDAILWISVIALAWIWPRILLRYGSAIPLCI